MMKRQLKISFALTFMIAVGAFLLSRATPGRSQQEGITLDQVKTTLEGLGLQVESSPTPGQQVLMLTWKSEHSGYSWQYQVFVSISDDRKLVWFLSPLQGVPDPSKVPAKAALELLHKNDADNGWYFSWDPDHKRFYCNRSFYYSEFTPQNVQSNLATFEKTLLETAPYWDPKQWDNPHPPIPSIMPSVTPQ
jgi:hypothetical protein